MLASRAIFFGLFRTYGSFRTLFSPEKIAQKRPIANNKVNKVHFCKSILLRRLIFLRPFKKNSKTVIYNILSTTHNPKLSDFTPPQNVLLKNKYFNYDKLTLLKMY